MTQIHIMLDLETWGTEPGCDIRSIGACVFDPVSGTVADATQSFYIATDNPIAMYVKDEYGLDTSNNDPTLRRYPLTRDPKTEQWWSEQSEEAQAAFADSVDLRDALMRFTAWLEAVTPFEELGGAREYAAVRLWSHGKAFDPVILAAAYRGGQVAGAVALSSAARHPDVLRYGRD